MNKSSRAAAISIAGNTGLLTYVPKKTISLKSHPQFNEMWLQDRIHEDPTILGLGDVVVMQRERPQPKAGRLDFLLKHLSSGRRFTMELQLGSLDESHIIRTIEYWDSERRRYPQVDHCAVICAETINARFLNVVSLFNGHIPLIALQVTALQVNDSITLAFTKVLDEVQLGTTEIEQVPETTRAFWEQKSSLDNLKVMDTLVQKIQGVVGVFELKFNKYYIGCVVQGRPANFIAFKPQKSGLRLDLGVKLTDQQVELLENEGIEVLDYTDHWHVHPIRITREQALNPPPVLLEMIKFAFTDYFE